MVFSLVESHEIYRSEDGQTFFAATSEGIFFFAQLLVAGSSSSGCGQGQYQTVRSGAEVDFPVKNACRFEQESIFSRRLIEIDI